MVQIAYIIRFSCSFCNSDTDTLSISKCMYSVMVLGIITTVILFIGLSLNNLAHYDDWWDSTVLKCGMFPRDVS